MQPGEVTQARGCLCELIWSTASVECFFYSRCHHFHSISSSRQPYEVVVIAIVVVIIFLLLKRRRQLALVVRSTVPGTAPAGSVSIDWCRERARTFHLVHLYLKPWGGLPYRGSPHPRGSVQAPSPGAFRMGGSHSFTQQTQWLRTQRGKCSCQFSADLLIPLLFSLPWIWKTFPIDSIAQNYHLPTSSFSRLAAL